MSISFVVAVAKNNVIGKENTLPWYLPEDLKRFKALTTGKTVLMGRKTFESILKKLGKPLPQRVNVVITRDENYKAPEGVVVYNDLKTALDVFKNEEVMVIGGGQIYRQTIDLADTLYVTHVDEEIAGDVFFPTIDPAVWQKTDEEKHDSFTFATYKRK